MKTALALLTLATMSLSLHATEVKITPEYPSKCEESKYSQLVTRIKNFEKVETTETVEISFDTYLYKCSESNLSSREISDYKFIEFFHEGINLPFSYTPEYAITSPSSLEDHIVIKFDKSIIFKKKTERTFSYHLKSSNPRALFFFWNINLKYERETDTTTVNFVKNNN
jgi:hypothetical protein